MGAVHRVTIGDEPVHLRIDAGLQEAAHSSPCLGLRYPDAATASSRVIGHARGLARVAGASRLLLIRSEGGSEEHTLTLIDVGTGRALDEETLLSSADDANLAETLVAIAQSGGLLAHADAPSPPSQTHAEADAIEEPPIGTYPPVEGGARIAGLSLVSAGGLALGLAGVYMIQLGTNRDQFTVAEPNDFDFNERRDALDTAQLMVTLLSATGGALSSAATALLVRGADATPLWAWISGATGLGAIGGGIALMASAPSCEGGAAPNRTQRDDCGARAGRLSLGALLVSVGAPLLSLPLTYLLKSPRNGTAGETNANLHLRVVANGATLSVEGHL